MNDTIRCPICNGTDEHCFVCTGLGWVVILYDSDNKKDSDSIWYPIWEDKCE